MAIYAIGDIQGCMDELLRLLERIQYDPAKDQLWFVGDIVNRGPKSLQSLRFVANPDNNAITVLGNHDLNLLAVSEGVRTVKRHDTLNDILNADDAADLLQWLRQQPLLHHDKNLKAVMVHAGFAPQWKLKHAKKYAKEVESVLAGPSYREFLHAMYGNKPNKWKKSLQGMERLRFITNAFTRIRYCDQANRLNMQEHGAPGTQSKKLTPWFAIPERKSRKTKIVFGHWSTLGLKFSHNTIALDTGCLWGGELTAVRLDTAEPQIISIDCDGAVQPKL
ncbi:MAG TPA: diadenosine tetraphosphatase [Gammaproteobacteria bacterium]|nr:diadenosine tetraphosphatase [Gammaproteobacteria bacterium]